MSALQHIHPMLLHFPIALILLPASFDLVATQRGQSETGRTTIGTLSILPVVAIAVFAAATFHFGDLALTIAEECGFSSAIAETHESLGEMVMISTVIYALLRVALWWRDVRVKGALTAVFPLAAIAASVLVTATATATATAYYGGQLVYDLGVNLAAVGPAISD